MNLEQININDVIIETARLILRPFKQEDLKDFYDYASIAGLGEAAGWKYHKNIDESKAVLNAIIAEHRIFAIEEKPSGKVIGSIGFDACPDILLSQNLGESVFSIGYVLNPVHWDMGYAQEAISAILSYSFYRLCLEAVTCACFADNQKGREVIEACGFTPVAEGKYTTQLGETYSAKYYALTHAQYGVKYV